ncbi:ParA family protein [Rubrivirga marina]|uniref:AAA domain-containing protein n=1 Tax=Rubrivirga marina TaxID=1196024 RepID=A0A271IUB0_9BACT|nr:ParA family protein [Rubrivirga marina]PAP74159.1 hypothetical protein BSZ37_21070 [Rubrivirga marina]
MPTPSPLVLAVALTKGGTGKTTTAANLAAELAALFQERDGDAARRVLLVDADPQDQLAGALGVDPEAAVASPGLSGVLSASEAGRPARAVEAVVADVRPGLDVCPAGDALATESSRLGADPAAGLLAVGDAIEALAEAVRGDAPLVVVDVPPGWGPLALGVLAASDVVLAPVSLQPLALQALGTFVGHLGGVQRTRQRFGGERLPLLLQIVPTMFDSRPVAHGQVLEAIRAAAAEIDRGDGAAPVVAEPVPQSVRVQEAAALGRTVREHARSGHGSAAAYVALAERVAADLDL